ncbi:MAG: cytochrome c oxidase assembly protein [Alphaproteobacteria bacterium]
MRHVTYMLATVSAAVRARRNGAVALALVGVLAGMGTLVYFSVPLYRLFCEVTGFGGTTQASTQAPGTIIDRQITVRFDANVAQGLPWLFAAPPPVTVRIGEERVVAYKGKNVGREPYLGTATFNVTPFKAGEYFNKIQCFCFTEQLLQPGEEQEFTVSFFVDPKIVDDRNASDVTTITLSYTFFDQGRAARDRYMREHKLSAAPSAAEAVADTLHGADGERTNTR